MDVFNQAIVRQVHKKLNECLPPNGSFYQLLKDKNAYISGSFIVQCILDENYDSDIDIYIPQSKMDLHDDIDEFFKDCCVISDIQHYNLENEPDLTKICRVVTYNFKKSIILDEDEEEDILPLCHHQYDDIIKNHKDIQFIYVDTDDIPNYIKETFDFDICKNYYKDNNVFITNLYDILNKKLTFNMGPEQNVNKSIDRSFKYKERGFTIFNPKTIHDYVENITVYHVNYINDYFYDIKSGDLTMLKDIENYIYLTKESYKKVPKLPIYNKKYNRCHFCRRKCDTCDCIETRQKCKQFYFNFNDLKQHCNDLIYLSDTERSTEADKFISFCYPNNQWRIYWTNQDVTGYKQYYLFVID
jgi:hypothetical protein